jgi:endoglucanase
VWHKIHISRGGKTMNTFPITGPGRRFAITSLASVATIIVIAGALALTFAPMLVKAQSGSAFVRVNQVGYAATASKRAYLMASGAEAGTTFSVKNASGATVYSAPIGANLGSWSNSYPDVYALDFDSVTTAGSYTIVTSGPIAGSSPGFTIGTAANEYTGALSNALSFYENERDGSNYIPSALRTAPGHLNDASAMTYLTPNMNSSGRFSGDLSPLGVKIDASGGWWDAGDYLKFVETISYTVDILQLGVRDFPNQMGSGSTTANFTAEAKFGLDWLQHMWNDTTQTPYYQVGIGSGNSKTIGDHDIWRLPQADDNYGGTNPLYRYIRNRPVFRAGPAGALISPNLAGRLAADFALCFQIFKSSNPAYANQCLLSAEHIFALANTNPSGNLLTVAPYSFYPETEWRDDLEFGATELYFALASGNLPAGLPHTDPLFYLQSAAHWAHAYITGPNDAADTLNLYDVSSVAHYELYHALAQAGNPGGLEVTQATLLSDLKKQLDKAVAQAGTDPFGFGFPWATFDTTSHGAGLVVMASEYDHLTGTTAYASYGVQWLANILGANAWGISLIVGDGSTFPHCMQHQVANLAGSLDGSPPILAGAAVEGPNRITSKGLVSGMVTCPANGVDQYAQFNGSSAVYQDNVQSWSTDEPAVDLTATSPLAFAWQIAA